MSVMDLTAMTDQELAMFVQHVRHELERRKEERIAEGVADIWAILTQHSDDDAAEILKRLYQQGSSGLAKRSNGKPTIDDLVLMELDGATRPDV
ncbi:MAG: hypothetical protein F6K19_49780 [Cyanothece sp. SIO1E1]|nr:hypothetical protein [Cyanothece sp. SIO1E1]